jgi:CheY-like chemotaxis protein
MPGELNGLDVAKFFYRSFPEIPVIVISANPGPSFSSGFEYLPKPYTTFSSSRNESTLNDGQALAIDPMPETCILIVEPDILVRHPLAQFLRDCEFRVLVAGGQQEAHDQLADPQDGIDLVLADIDEDQDGFTFAYWLRLRIRPFRSSDRRAWLEPLKETSRPPIGLNQIKRLVASGIAAKQGTDNRSRRARKTSPKIPHLFVRKRY